nr:hypothetical protein [uncultured Peptostreptococcus sp.]
MRRDYNYYEKEFDCMICCYDKKEFDKIREIINRIGRDKCIDSTRKRNEILMYLDEYRARKDAHRDGFNSKAYTSIVSFAFVIIAPLVFALSNYMLSLINGNISVSFENLSNLIASILAVIIVLFICEKIGFRKIKKHVELVDKIDYIENQIKYLL